MKHEIVIYLLSVIIESPLSNKYEHCLTSGAAFHDKYEHCLTSGAAFHGYIFVKKHLHKYHNNCHDSK